MAETSGNPLKLSKEAMAKTKQRTSEEKGFDINTAAIDTHFSKQVLKAGGSVREGVAIGKPFKICDLKREKRKGIVASSLQDLLSKSSEKLSLSGDNLTVVLEADGTEIDDEEYFSTLGPNTELMVLSADEKWSRHSPKISLDVTDDVAMQGKGQVVNIIGSLHHDLCHIAVLSNYELELLSDLDPDSLAAYFKGDNKGFLEQIKEASARLLLEKRQAQDAMELLKLYDQSVKNANSDPPAAKKGKV